MSSNDGLSGSVVAPAATSAATSAGDAARLPVSFELFPPRSDAAAIALGRTIDRLAEYDPAFISVTFGAGGSTRDRSLTVLSYILEHTDVHPMAHLTCVGSTVAGASQLVRQFLDAGITSFLALRGDPPKDAPGEGFGPDGLGELRTAAELVQLIHRVQRERVPWLTEALPGLVRGARLHAYATEPVEVAVACFPNGHPRSRTPDQDIDALLAKQASGATLAITQLVFSADCYATYVERARSAGVTIPILPGVLPITSLARLRRTLTLTGEAEPTALAAALAAAETEQDAFDRGIEAASALLADLVKVGAPGLHLYTLNRYDAVSAALDRLGYTATPTSSLLRR